MIKYVETEKEKLACFELICLEIDEDKKYNKDLIYPSKENLLKLMSDNINIFLIYKQNEEVIGYVCAHKYMYTKEYDISGIYVKKDYRRKGIGSKLINEILKIAKEDAIVKINLHAYSENIVSVKFYENFGFREITKEFSLNL